MHRLSCEKKVVEYTFKNSPSEKVQTAILHQYNFTLQSAGTEKVIPYANITSVRLSRTGNKEFKMVLVAENHGTVTVSNKYYLPDGQLEDRSRQYSTFVRVLHYHLKEKSSTEYLSGFSLRLFGAWLLASAFLAFFITFVSEYLGASMINPFGQGLILTLLFVGILFIIYKGRLPRHYSPSEIPLQFLP